MVVVGNVVVGGVAGVDFHTTPLSMVDGSVRSSGDVEIKAASVATV